MTKAEYIERYGIDWYEAQKAKKKERYNNDPEFRAAQKARQKERYNNDPEFRAAHKAKKKERYANDPEFRAAYKAKCKERYANDPEFRAAHKAKMTLYKYCRAGEYERIENYELAKADNFKGWDIHHRLELTLDGEYANSAEDLKRLDMYYNRPYFELIFLRHGEHSKLHRKARR